MRRRGHWWLACGAAMQACIYNPTGSEPTNGALGTETTDAATMSVTDPTTTDGAAGTSTTTDVTTADSLGDTTAGTNTGTSSGSSSTGDDTTTTGMSTTGSTTDVTTMGMTESTDTSSTGTTTGDDSMLGDPCAGDPQFYCEGSGPGKIGQLLQCDGMWKMAECLVADCPALGFPQYKVVGCSGEIFFGCICQADPGTPCVPADQGCDPNDMTTMTLCLDGVLSKTICTDCYDDPNGPYCGE